jgi:hypothetical protein
MNDDNELLISEYEDPNDPASDLGMFFVNPSIFGVIFFSNDVYCAFFPQTRYINECMMGRLCLSFRV